MSFIYDENVFKYIIDQAFNKKAQAKNPNSADNIETEFETAQDIQRNKQQSQIAKTQQDAISAVKKLSQKLSNEISGKTTQSNISTNLNATDLKIQNLYNISELLKFLADNQVKINNLKIVTNADDKAKNPSASDYLDNNVKTQQILGYTINPQALSLYIQSLQTKFKDNKFIVALLDNLVVQANKYLENKLADTANVSKQADLETPIDKLDKAFSTTKNGNGNSELKLKDIENNISFNAWLKNTPPASIVIDNKIIPISEPEFYKNIKVIFDVLSVRADYFIKSNSDPNKTNIYNTYKQKIQSLAQQFGTSVSGTSQEQIQAANFDQKLLDQLINNNYPLNSNEVNISIIERFLNTFEKMFKDNQLIPAIRDDINNVKSKLLNDKISLTNLNSNTFSLILRDHKTDSTIQQGIIQKIQNIVSRTGMLISSLRNVPQMEKFTGTVGVQLTIAQDNFNKLDYAKRN